MTNNQEANQENNVPFQNEYLLHILNEYFEDELIKSVILNLGLKYQIEKYASRIEVNIFNDKGTVYHGCYYASINTPVNDRYTLCASFYKREISSVLTSLVNYQTIQNLNLK